MRGTVDEAGRALLCLLARANQEADTSELVVWVDTAFDGELVIPLSTIQDLSLPQTSAVQAILADGTDVILETFSCRIEWFGVWRDVEVIANDGRLPLLGVGLLMGHDLHVSYRTGELRVE